MCGQEKICSSYNNINLLLPNIVTKSKYKSWGMDVDKVYFDFANIKAPILDNTTKMLNIMIT